MASDLERVLDYLAADLVGQAQQAHLDGKPQAADALFGAAAAVRRAEIDVLDRDETPARRRRLRDRLGL